MDKKGAKGYWISTAKIIDQEVRKLIENAESHARKILKKNLKHLHNLADALLEFETLSGDDVRELIKKGKLKQDKQPKNNINDKKTSLPVGKKTSSKKKIGLNPDPLTT